MRRRRADALVRGTTTISTKTPIHARRLPMPAAVLAVGCFALYASQRHGGLFENGPELMELWRRGILVHTHALLLPLARLAAALGLAGSPAVPDRAVSLISSFGAALAVAVVVARATGWTGRREALLAGLLLGLAPVLRFYAGAVETRALGCGCAAVAGALAGSASPTRARALAWTTAGYVLACAAHVSLVALGPALLLLHADSEARASRPITPARLVTAGAVLAAGAVATAGALYAADQLLNPALANTRSWLLYYFQAASDWGSAVGRPHPLTWLVAEILGPSGVLVPLGLVGVLPLLRRAPWRAAALLVWTLLIAFASYGVGSRQLGGYFLAALPALGWLAAEGLRHLFIERSRAAAAGAAALALFALLAFPAALAAWLGGGGEWIFGGKAHRILGVQRNDLALPWPGPDAALAQIHPLAWLGAGTLAALLAGALRGSAAGARQALSPLARAAPVWALAALALGLQIAGGESARKRWPIHWGQQARDYCEAARAVLGPRDWLFTAVPTSMVAWQFNYYLGDRWTNLGQEAELSEEERPGWLAGLEAQLTRTRTAGGTAYLAEAGLQWLEEHRSSSPLALAAVRRWVSERLVVVWSAG